MCGTNCCHYLPRRDKQVRKQGLRHRYHCCMKPREPETDGDPQHLVRPAITAMNPKPVENAPKVTPYVKPFPS